MTCKRQRASDSCTRLFYRVMRTINLRIYRINLSVYTRLGSGLLDHRLRTLRAGREILAAVGSWGETLDDEEVLDLLKEWNAGEAKIRRN